MASGRNYNVTLRTGADGAQYVRIREAPPERNRSEVRHYGARQPASALFENLNLFKAGVQKALRSVGRAGRG